MAAADPSTVVRISQFAADPARVRVSRQVQWDLFAHKLTKDEVCEAILQHTGAGERVTQITLDNAGALSGQPAFVLKTRLCDRLFYVKVTFCNLPGQPDQMLLLSAHPDH